MELLRFCLFSSSKSKSANIDHTEITQWNAMHSNICMAWREIFSTGPFPPFLLLLYNVRFSIPSSQSLRSYSALGNAGSQKSIEYLVMKSPRFINLYTNSSNFIDKTIQISHRYYMEKGQRCLNPRHFVLETASQNKKRATHQNGDARCGCSPPCLYHPGYRNILMSVFL